MQPVLQPRSYWSRDVQLIAARCSYALARIVLLYLGLIILGFEQGFATLVAYAAESVFSIRNPLYFIMVSQLISLSAPFLLHFDQFSTWWIVGNVLPASISLLYIAVLLLGRRRAPVYGALPVFLGLLMVTILYAPDPLYAAGHFVRLSSFLTALFALRVLIGRTIVQYYLVCLVLLSAAQSIAVVPMVYDYIVSGGGWVRYGVRYGWLAETPTWLGVFAALGFTIEAVLAGVIMRGIAKSYIAHGITRIGLATGYGFLLWTSGGRTGIVALATGIMFPIALKPILMLSKKKAIRARLPQVLKVVAVVGVLFIVSYLHLARGVFDIGGSPFFAQYSEREAATLTGRLEAWRVLVRELVGNPDRFLLGFGYGASRMARTGLDFGVHRADTHSSYLSWFLEGGVIGLVFLVLSLICVARFAKRLVSELEADALFMLMPLVCVVIAGATLQIWSSSLRVEGALIWLAVVGGISKGQQLIEPSAHYRVGPAQAARRSAQAGSGMGGGGVGKRL